MIIRIRETTTDDLRVPQYVWVGHWRRRGGPVNRALASCAALIAVALMALSWPIDASAQRTGTRIGKSATIYDTSETIALVAACMAERRAKISRAMLATLPGSDEEYRVMLRSEGTLGLCMHDERFNLDGKKLMFSSRALRPSLGVAVARRLIADGKPISVAPADAKPWFADALSKNANADWLDLPLLALMEMGDCIVNHESGGAMELVASQPGTPEQGRAMRKLIPHLPGCVIAGQEIEITPETLRYAVAEPIVHRFDVVPTEDAE